MKNITILDPVISIRSVMTEQNISDMGTLADELLK
jgi:hypothetical protein